MSEMIKNNKTEQNNQEQLSLDDGRRVKVLSPGMMVFKRFIRVLPKREGMKAVPGEGLPLPTEDAHAAI